MKNAANENPAANHTNTYIFAPSFARMLNSGWLSNTLWKITYRAVITTEATVVKKAAMNEMKPTSTDVRRRVVPMKPVCHQWEVTRKMPGISTNDEGNGQEGDPYKEEGK